MNKNTNKDVANVSGGNMQEGFFQSEDEFSLDIAPRSKQAMLRHVERMDSMSIEPETADFLRGYMIGKFQPLD